MLSGDWPSAIFVRPRVASMSEKQPEQMVEDLAMLVRQLVQLANKQSPNNALAARAADYLQRNGLDGSPLRSD